MRHMTQKRPGPLHRCWTHLLDGEHRWGFTRLQADRFGVTRYRLVVYPPGISDEERRHLRIWRGAPVWGTALWVVLETLLAQPIGTWSTLAVSTATVTGLAVAALARAGANRTKVRAMTVVTMAGLVDAATIAARDELLATAMTLTTADRRLREGDMSPLEHEALWWEIYERLAPPTRVTR